MPLVYIFCFWFSLRLGAVISSICCALRAITCILIMTLPINMDNLKDRIGQFLLNIDYNKSIVNFVMEDFQIVFLIIGSFFAMYSLTCILLGTGAVLCKPRLCYPFVGFHGLLILLDLFLYSILFKYLMNLASLPSDEQHMSSFGLTEAIFYLTLGIFYIFFDVYLEVCVTSFIEVVYGLEKSVIRRTMQPIFRLGFKSQELERRGHQIAPVKLDGTLFTKALFIK